MTPSLIALTELLKLQKSGKEGFGIMCFLFFSVCGKQNFFHNGGGK
jgi:hypothetical protein